MKRKQATGRGRERSAPGHQAGRFCNYSVKLDEAKRKKKYTQAQKNNILGILLTYAQSQDTNRLSVSKVSAFYAGENIFRTNFYANLFIIVSPPLDIESSENQETGQCFAFGIPHLFCGIYKNQLNSLSAVPRPVLDFIHTLWELVF